MEKRHGSKRERSVKHSVVTRCVTRGIRCCSQTVTGSASRVYESLLRICINLSAQVIDVDVNHVGQGVRRKPPNMMDDRGARHIVAGIEHGGFEQPEVLGCTLDRTAARMY